MKEEPAPGQATRAWAARCAQCGHLGFAISWGQRYAFEILRSNRWSKKAAGWTCPECSTAGPTPHPNQISLPA
jgi:hypothetical protein